MAGYKFCTWQIILMSIVIIMDHFIGSHLGISVQPLSSIAHYWNEKDVGFITAQKFAIKSGLQINR